MRISEFLSKLQGQMPQSITVERIEDHKGVLRGLVTEDGQEKFFTVLLDGPPDDALVRRASERILVALQ